MSAAEGRGEATPASTSRTRTDQLPFALWLKSRLQHGKRLIGTFLQLHDLPSCEVLARAGFDFLCVEAEHSPLDRHQIDAMVHAVIAEGTPCLVRTADAEQSSIAAALDTAAAGLLIPRVGSAEQANRAVEAARFPPRGRRGIGPARATGYGPFAAEYVAEAEQHLLVAAQIETHDGFKNRGEIASVDGIDMLFVGPGDLALSLGIGVTARHEELCAAIRVIFDSAAEHGKLTGIFCGTASEAVYWLEGSANLVIVGSDLAFLARGAAEAAGTIRRVVPAS